MEKRVMSFTQLIEIGYSRDQLKTYAKEDDFPGYKTPGGGKWLVYVDKLPAWIEKYNARRELLSMAAQRAKRRKIYGRQRGA